MDGAHKNERSLSRVVQKMICGCEFEQFHLVN